MKKTMKKLVSVIASLALFFNCCPLSLAANESNTNGITFSVSLDNATVSANSGEQIVVMTLTASADVTADGVGFTVVYDDALTLTSIEAGAGIVANDFDGGPNLGNGTAGWNSPDAESYNIGTQLADITFTVPANTPAGSYSVGVEAITLSTNYGGTEWESTASASTTLTVQGGAPVAGYSAGLSVASANATLDSTVYVNVAVNHDKDSVFAAGEIEVSYDTTRLQFSEDSSTLGNATCEEAAGVISLVDYGANKTLGNNVYTLAFTTEASGNATVTMTSAAFADKADAETKDLIDATISPASVTLVIAKRTYTVSLPNIFTGNATVTEGEDYTFSATDKNNYNYGTVTATMGGNSVTVIDNGDGTYTIRNVTGNLVISGTRTPKQYSVTFQGSGAADVTDGEATATYGVDYSFTIPSEEGYTYSVTSITIGGESSTAYGISGSVCTIDGDAITGDIVITITKTQSTFSVTVTGSGAGAAAGYATTAEKDEDYTLTLTPEKGYIYTVTATMGGESVTVINNGDNTYTVKTVTGALVFTVERTVDTSGVSVSAEPYLPLNGTNMWLVLSTGTLDSGKVWTYNGVNMYWSEKYNAYCYLVVADTLSAETAKAAVGINAGSATTVSYGKDVNMSGSVDASDAQLTYNMYMKDYAGFTASVTMEKYLRADVNGNKVINVQDAIAIVTAILE